MMGLPMTPTIDLARMQKHHPYCQHIKHRVVTAGHGDMFVCQCETFRAYDKWKAENVWNKAFGIVGQESISKPYSK